MKKPLGTIVVVTSMLLCSVITAADAQPQWTLDTVITTGTNPTGIAITPDGSKVVVADNSNPGAVAVISTATYAVTPIDVSSIENYPNAVAISPDGLTAFVATTHKIVLVDLTKNATKGNFAAPCVGTTLYGLAVTPDGQTAIFPDLSSGCTQQGLRSISAAAPSGSTFITVSTSGVLYDFAITPDGASAIVTTNVSDSPKKVNLSTQGVQNITGFSGSYSVAVLHHSNEAVIQGDSLKRVSLNSNAATKYLSDIYSTSIQGIAITADDNYAFVVGAFQKVIVDLTSNTVIQTFTAGATSVAVMPDGSRFFVTDSYNGTTRVYKRVTSTGIDITRTDLENPGGFALAQCFPNPFNPTTVVSYQLPVASDVKLEIFDLLGRQVAVLVDGWADPGNHQVTFNGSSLASGTYLCRLQAGIFSQTRRMVLLK